MRRRIRFALSRPATPFQHLVMHFVKRMFASDEEQGTGTVSLGLGAALAVLALPGAFASIFLLDKYSTLMQWFRGQVNFNPYRASVGDEYFFVVLSMTITGLVMVLRWNRLLPDFRDFANLAVLPIPIRNVFLANFTALLGLGLLFGIDVNAVSAFLFPAFVTLSDGSVSAFAHLAAAHAAAVFSASLFSFFAVFAAVGILMLVVPKRMFRPVSIGVRVVLVVALLSEFFSNLFLQLFSGRLPHLREFYMHWLPSYWFLGVYEHVLGIANATMNALAKEAVIALGGAIVVAVAAYGMCYRRHFLRLAESLETIGFTRHSFRMKLPEVVERILFRSKFEHACNSFICRVLLRSERHLMFLGGYLGIGLVLAAQMAADSASKAGAKSLPNGDWLAVPLIVALVLVTGLRFAFDIPAALEANWLFRMATEAPMPRPAAVVRRFMLWAVLPWEVMVVGSITARTFGWAVAAEHVATLTIVTVLLIDAVLVDFRKIPFTCAARLESKTVLVRILGPVFGALLVAPALASFERWMMPQPARFAVFGILAGSAWYILKRYKGASITGEETIRFEEQGGATFEILKLS